jgi:3-dehydroquinate dehydratase
MVWIEHWWMLFDVQHYCCCNYYYHCCNSTTAARNNAAASTLCTLSVHASVAYTAASTDYSFTLVRVHNSAVHSQESFVYTQQESMYVPV